MRAWKKTAQLVFVGALTFASPVIGETLSDSLATAYRTSGLIDQNRAVLRAADEDVALALTALRPVISYALGADYTTPSVSDEFSLTASVTGSLLLYDFGRSDLGVDVAKESVLATRAALVDIENNILLNTATAFFNVRRAEAFVELRENNVRLLVEQLRAARDRFEVGEVTRTDVSQAEARVAAARSALAADQGGLAQSRELFKSIVGRFPGQLQAPPRAPAIPDAIGGARGQAQRNNPQLLQVQHQVKAAELAVEQARREIYPSLNATGSFAIDDDADDRTSLGLTLSGPIYQGGAIASGQRRAQALRDQARAQLYTTGLLVDQQVGNAYANLGVAIASIDASNRQVAAAQLALEGIQEELQLGARTTLDVLDQEQELLDAQTALVSAQADRQIAIYQVLDSIGLLTAENLGLNVPIYDPATYYNAVKDGPTYNVSPEGKRLDRVLKAIGRQ